jgi:ADP-heptose:LPS heptosyltransferase
MDVVRAMRNRSRQCNGCRDSGSMIATLPGRGSNLVRLADRYVGIPLVFIMGNCGRKRAIPARPEKIGLLNTAAVGDTILMSGPILDLRAVYQNAEIVFFSGPSNYEAACLLEGSDLVIKLPVFSPLASIKAVREQNIDLLIDFGPWCRINALIAICSGARFIAGFRTNAQGRHFGYDLIVEHSEDAHELENHRGLIRALGIQPSHPPALRCEQSNAQTVEQSSKKFAVFHLWPGGTAARLKEWPIGRWVALAEDFAAKQYNIVLTGSASQRSLNEAVIVEVNASLRPLLRNAAGTSLHETLRLLSCAELVVSVDTGVMHMAAALGVPLVALHGPSSPRRWGPVSENALVVEPPVGGCGYLNLGFEHRRNPPPCMNAISYGQVKAACQAALTRAGLGHPTSLERYSSSTRALSPVLPVETAPWSRVAQLL